MTLEEFRIKFKATGLKLKKDADGWLRTVGPESRCPVCALCERETTVVFSDVNFRHAGKILGLSEEDTRRIVDTADNDRDDGWFDDQLRAELEAMVLMEDPS